MLDKCDLFTLLVTPNLINEENYVKTDEYPMAHDTGKKILPVEIVDTDQEQLKNQYKDIPDTVKAKEDAALKEGLAKAFSASS